MAPIVFSFPGQDDFAAHFSQYFSMQQGQVVIRDFPDGESYVQLESEVQGKIAIIVCSLHQPNTKYLALSFLIHALREGGASQVGLVAPYLGYMRQDIQFKAGEVVTAKVFHGMLSQQIDWLVTVDPHLHRIHSLEEIYTVKTRVVHAAGKIAEWIKANIPQPLVVGPDVESEQWVAKVAQYAEAPYLVLQKTRKGDREVEISLPPVDDYKGHTPVIIDDIVSTARTMIRTVHLLKDQIAQRPFCVGVHAVFAGDAYQALQASGVVQIITCNTIPHPTNGIGLEFDVGQAATALSGWDGVIMPV